MTSFVVKQGEPRDAAGCALLHVTSWRETYGHWLAPEFWERFTVESATAQWTRWLADDAPRWVAHDENLHDADDDAAGDVVGFAFARTSRTSGDFAPVRDLELFAIYVARSAHGTGVGQLLLDAAIDPGVGAQLWVAADNQRAIRFYQRNGFIPDGAADDGTLNSGIPTIRMVR